MESMAIMKRISIPVKRPIQMVGYQSGLGQAGDRRLVVIQKDFHNSIGSSEQEISSFSLWTGKMCWQFKLSKKSENFAQQTSKVLVVSYDHKSKSMLDFFPFKFKTPYFLCFLLLTFSTSAHYHFF